EECRVDSAVAVAIVIMTDLCSLKDDALLDYLRPLLFDTRAGHELRGLHDDDDDDPDRAAGDDDDDTAAVGAETVSGQTATRGATSSQEGRRLEITSVSVVRHACSNVNFILKAGVVWRIILTLEHKRHLLEEHGRLHAGLLDAGKDVDDMAGVLNTDAEMQCVLRDLAEATKRGPLDVIHECLDKSQALPSLAQILARLNTLEALTPSVRNTWTMVSHPSDRRGPEFKSGSSRTPRVSARPVDGDGGPRSRCWWPAFVAPTPRRSSVTTCVATSSSTRCRRSTPSAPSGVRRCPGLTTPDPDQGDGGACGSVLQR
ncbi:MAG: hypothetical protein QM757_12890, partial [Paludibaculum sp.]